MIDSHAHLDDEAFAGDRAAVIERAGTAGVQAMVAPGIDLASSGACLRLAAQTPAVFAAVGVHPHQATSLAPGALDALREMAGQPKVVAIGEIGLDWYRNLSPRQAQIDACAAQIDLAAELGLPIIVHDREAHRETLEMLARAARAGVGGVLHAFSGNGELARQALDAGFYISFGGPLTYKNAHNLRQVARIIPLERVLLETDCPYLPPVPHRGERNEPAYVGLVAQTLAAVTERPLAEVDRTTSLNAARLFKLPVSVEDDLGRTRLQPDS